MAVKAGFLFGMNDCQTSVIGAEFRHMGKRIVKLGSRRGMPRKRSHRSLGSGSEPLKNEPFAECRSRWRGGAVELGPE